MAKIIEASGNQFFKVDDRTYQFESKEEAEKFCARERGQGNKHARVATLNSVLMTSSTAPIVVNVGFREMLPACSGSPEVLSANGPEKSDAITAFLQAQPTECIGKSCAHPSLCSKPGVGCALV